jgi:membrane protease YdiL (CAAX protease family)
MKAAIYAVLVGLGVALAISVPWMFLAMANVRLSPNVPWSVPMMLAYLGFVMVWLNGWWWPRSNSALRHDLLRWRWPRGSVWAWALAAGTLGVLALWAFYAALGNLSHSGTARESTGLSPGMVVVAVVMGSLVTALSEEAGFRGYMLSNLVPRFKPTSAVVIVSVVFSLFHLTHGASALLQNGIFYFGASCVYCVLTYFSGSILPSILLHFAGDVFVFAMRASVVKVHLPYTAAAIAAYVLAGLALGGASIGAFARLARRTRRQIAASPEATKSSIQ